MGFIVIEQSDKSKEGFTLVEIVVIIGVMSILALMMVPNITAYVGKADDAKIQTNIKTFHTAAEMVDKTDIAYEEPGYKERVGLFANVEDPTELAKYKVAKSRKGLLIVSYDGYIFDGQTVGLDENIANSVDIGNYSSVGEVDSSRYLSDGIITYEDFGSNDVYWGGVFIRHNDVMPYSTYEFTYSYKKKSGTMVSFGGHTDPTYSDNVVYLDGRERAQTYSAPSSVYSGDNTDMHHVKVIIKTGAKVKSSDRIFIQPNRGNGTPVKIEIYNMKLVAKDIGGGR